MKFLFGKITPHGVQPGMFGGIGPFFSGLLGLLWAPFRFLGFVTVIGGRVAAGWFGKRQFRYLLYGVPSIIAFVVFGVFLIRGVMYGGSHRADQYANAAAKAAKAGQWKEAQLFYQRAIDMGRNERSTLFELAKAAEKNGDEPVKVAVMDSLAPVQVATFAPAHLWQAARVLSNQPVPADRIPVVEAHLRHALSLDANNRYAHLMLGELYFQSGKMKLAQNHLTQVIQRSPEHRLMLAKTHGLLGQKEQAKQWAAQAVDYYSDRIERNSDDVEAHLALSDAYFFQEEFPKAASILQRATQANPDSKALRYGLARVYVQWSDSLQGMTEEIRQAKFELLSAALLANPDEMLVFDRLISHLATDEALSAEGREMLLQNIAEGRGVAMSHLILGTLSDPGTKESQMHLEMAYEELPTAPVVINNLAWALAQQETPDLQRAYDLIDGVIQRSGKQVAPQFLDTRGLILVKKGRWKDAIRDLELALPSHRTEAATHLALAEAYEQIGSPELALRHRKMAEKL